MNIHQSILELWEYLSVGDTHKKCEVLFVLGRDDFSIPERTVELYKQGLASTIVLIGGRGRLTGSIDGSEAEAFKTYLVSKGISAQSLLLEEKSTNTGENIKEGLRILAMNSITPSSVGIVTHGPHMRRSLAVAKAHNSVIEWLPYPDLCTVSNLSLLETQKIAQELLGEISRLEEYPKLGYFEDQYIPNSVLSAKEVLIFYLHEWTHS